MSASPGQRRVGGWTAEQDAIIHTNPTWSNAKIARAASLVGPKRTVGAADSRRRLLGISTPPGGSGGQYALWLATREIPSGEGPPWPAMFGSPAARDYEFVRKVREAALAAVRARKAMVGG